MSPISVYLHIPFCPSKCGYCDFNSYVMDGNIIEQTAEAIRLEVERSPFKGRPSKTIFLGGGTPTFLSSDSLCKILETVLEVHPPIEGVEITSEANPGTIDISKFKAMYQAGFNRISLGAQSFQNEDLIRLGRVHKNLEIEHAVLTAREAGFSNLNLDLMFALPGQSLMAWETNLDIAVSLSPEHLSLYCLTIEPGTQFYKLNLQNRLNLPEEDWQIKMYDVAVDIAKRAGYVQYEISNFAKPGFECRHNMAYWSAEDYLGYGPGAVGCILKSGSSNRYRYTNLKHPVRYTAAIESGARTLSLDLCCDQEELHQKNQLFEKVMLGIRLNRGLCYSDLGLDPEAIERVKKKGWIEGDANTIRLTRNGRHYCNEVIIELT